MAEKLLVACDMIYVTKGLVVKRDYDSFGRLYY